MKSLQIKTQDEEMSKVSKVDNTGNSTTNLSADKFDDTGDEEKLERVNADERVASPKTKSHSALFKIVICFFAALLSSTLQFAFIFGSDLIKIAESAEGPGATPRTGSAAIIWLFVIPLSTISSIVYGLYQGRDVPIENLWRSPVSRHIKIFICACIPWIGHIHLYGISANILLPPNIAAAVAWPILMGTTVAWGMVLSLKLGEWNDASTEAQRKQKLGLAVTAAGIIVVMISVAV